MRTDKLFYFLNKYNLKPSKRFSQNFLISDEVLSFMASHGKGKVLEIGPGLGFLTEKLSKNCDKVIAVEKDKNLVNVLQKEYNFDNVEIVCEDFLKFEEKNFDTVVSSIPYAISSQITFKLFDMNFESATLLYQKEFARRFISNPGEDDYSRLSVMSKIYSDIEILRDYGTPMEKDPDIVVQNIVASGDLEMKLNLDDIILTLPNCEYEPEQFPGLIYRLKEPKVVLLLFGSGKVVCTGAKSEGDVIKAIERVKKSLIEEGLA